MERARRQMRSRIPWLPWSPRDGSRWRASRQGYRAARGAGPSASVTLAIGGRVDGAEWCERAARLFFGVGGVVDVRRVGEGGRRGTGDNGGREVTHRLDLDACPVDRVEEPRPAPSREEAHQDSSNGEAQPSH